MLVTATASANGGYFATSWGWASLALFSLLSAALVAAPVRRPSAVQVAALAAWAGLVSWIWLSAAWAESPSQPVLEGERALVFLAGIGIVVLLGRRSLVTGTLIGVQTGIVVVSAYALATRMFPDQLGQSDPTAGYRLAAPVGYWNALGLLTVIGLLLGLGFAARGGTQVGRALAAASLVVLAPTLYFTFSRGSWIALTIGLLAAVALDRERVQLTGALVTASLAPATAVWLASRSDSLTHLQATLGQAAHDGHQLAFVTVGLAAAAAALALAFGRIEHRVWGRPRTRSAVAALSALLVAASLIGAFVRYGSPATIVRTAWRSFSAPPPQIGTNLNNRLFTFSGNGRADLWQVAWDDVTRHPVLGSGAGTYEQYWLQRRPGAIKVRDAHSLYLETLAELGPPGLALLLAALGLPLVAAMRSRGRPFVATTLGAYCAYLAHAAVDWDWETSAVTLVALLCGGALMALSRNDHDSRHLPWTVRAPAAVVTLALAVAASVGLLGNLALAHSSEAAAQGDWSKAETWARRAERWAPWGSAPPKLLGEAQLGAGDLAGARASFRHAISKDGKDWDLWFDLARASSGRAQKEALDRAAKLNPLSPEIVEFRAELKAQG